MLVLSRKVGQKIFIGPDIVITLVDIDRNKVRIGIEAPRDTAIYRQELLPLEPSLRPKSAPPADAEPKESNQ